MKNQDKKNFTVIEGNAIEEKTGSVEKVFHQTNPIVKKFLNFHNERMGKFSVKDLFKK